jgi:hypothetical protein
MQKISEASQPPMTFVFHSERGGWFPIMSLIVQVCEVIVNLWVNPSNWKADNSLVLVIRSVRESLTGPSVGTGRRCGDGLAATHATRIKANPTARRIRSRFLIGSFSSLRVTTYQ